MAYISRRLLARYVVDQLLAGQAVKKISTRLAAVLIDSKMTGQTDLVIDDINEELESRGLSARAVVTSAHALSADLKGRIAGQIQKAAGVNSVTIIENVEPAVIGGVRIETARHTWDKTVARQLQDIKGGI